jgi:hypothetical protein
MIEAQRSFGRIRGDAQMANIALIGHAVNPVIRFN